MTQIDYDFQPDDAVYAVLKTDDSIRSGTVEQFTGFVYRSNDVVKNNLEYYLLLDDNTTKKLEHTRVFNTVDDALDYVNGIITDTPTPTPTPLATATITYDHDPGDDVFVVIDNTRIEAGTILNIRFDVYRNASDVVTTVIKYTTLLSDVDEGTVVSDSTKVFSTFSEAGDYVKDYLNAFDVGDLFSNSSGVLYLPSVRTSVYETPDEISTAAVGEFAGSIQSQGGEDISAEAKSFGTYLPDSRPLYRDNPLRLEFDKIDDNLELVIPDGGWFDGTMIIATTDGTASYGLGVFGGRHQLLQSDKYFPGSDIVALLMIDRELTLEEIEKTESLFVDLGAAKDYSGSTDLSNWYRDHYEITSIPDIGDVSNVTNFERFAESCSNLVSIDTSNWNTSSATSFYNFVFDTPKLTTLDVSGWDMSNVTTLEGFAFFCSSLTALDVSNWNVANVSNFQDFARDCDALTTLDVSNWNTASAANMESFALSCSGLTSLDVSNWSTGNVTNFRDFARSCSSLTSLDLSNWNTYKVVDFAQFTFGCSNLTSVTINGGSGNPFADSQCTNYSFAFGNTNLDQQSIDDILVAIEAAGTSNGTFDQSGGSAPSATGEAAIDALVGREWTINVTGGYVPSNIDLYAGLQHYWNLNEVSGTRIDSSGGSPLTDNNTVGNIQGVGTSQVAANFVAGNSEWLSFVNTAEEILPAGDFSIAFWYYVPSDGNGFGTIKLSDNAGTTKFVWQTDRSSGKITYITLTDTDTGALSFVPSTDNQWIFCVITYDDTAKVINQGFDGADPAGGSPGVGSVINAAVPFELGRSSTSFYDDAAFQAVGIWNRVLSSEEITTLYNEGTSALLYDDLPGTKPIVF